MKISDLKSIKLSQDQPQAMPSSFDTAWKFVEKHCSEVLQHYKTTHKILYRGVKKGGPDIFLGQPREHREVVAPRVESQPYAELCDLYLKTMGFSALRLSSIFCNASSNKASPWGNVFMIFPFNGFTFTWSKLRTDMSAMHYIWGERHFNNPFHENLRALSRLRKGEPIDMPEETKLALAEKFVSINRFDQSNFEEALLSDFDIWFAGRYIAFNKKFQDNVLLRLFGHD